MKSRFFYLAPFAAAALALSGCEWGGAHEHTWNDGYSWANFTGTYRFVNAVHYVPVATDSSESGSTSDTQEVEKKENHGAQNVTMTSPKASNGVLECGAGVIPGTFKATVQGNTITDDGQGNLIFKNQSCGTISYTGGSWSFSTSGLNASAGDPVAVTYDYYTTQSPASTVTVPDAADTPNAVFMSYLNVTQKGNTFTMTGDSGMVYSGRITGSNVGRDDYQAARTIYVSFEASAANGQKITGNFSGVWSGASEKSYGVLSSRQIHGTHSRAGNFVGVAADTTITVPDISVSE